MRFACWITKAMDTHSEYVIFTYCHGNMVSPSLFSVTLYAHCLYCFRLRTLGNNKSYGQNVLKICSCKSQDRLGVKIVIHIALNLVAFSDSKGVLTCGRPSFLDVFCYSVGMPVSYLCLLPSATAWTARELDLGGGEIFRIRLDRPWDSPKLLYEAYQVILGGTAAREWR